MDIQRADQQRLSRGSPSGRWIPLGLFSLSLGFGLVAIGGSHFEGLYGQDSFAYYGYALGPLRASLLHGQAPPPFFWPLGYPLLAALASLLVGNRGPQLVSLLAAALVPLFTFALADEVLAGENSLAPRRRRIATLSGVLAALCGLLLQAGTVVMSDASALAWATLAAWALVRYGRGGRVCWLALAAFSLAWSILTRWAYGLLVLPFAAYGLATLLRPSDHPQPNLLRRLVGHTGAAVLAGLIVLGPELVLAFLPSAGGDGPAHVGDLQVVGWWLGNALKRNFVTVDGHLSYPLPTGIFYATAIARPSYFTPLLAPAILAGFWSLWRRRAWRLAVLLVGWPAIVYLFLAGIAWQSLRFTLQMLPPLAMLIALGLDEVHDGTRGRTRTLAMLWIVAGLALMFGGAMRNISIFTGEMNANVATAGWVAGQVPADAQVLTFNLTSTLDHYTALDVQDIFFQSPETLPQTLASHRPVYLFVDVASLEQQWVDRSPEITYRWLRDNPGLTTLGHWESYTLFRVGDGR
ncbi:MAG: hypothetical protein M5U01_14165 [Ardenticatenaceae bacterium]|nr:hypothetical protein [Ardenticatenaceae bacterium]